MTEVLIYETSVFFKLDRRGQGNLELRVRIYKYSEEAAQKPIEE